MATTGPTRGGNGRVPQVDCRRASGLKISARGLVGAPLAFGFGLGVPAFRCSCTPR
jgi:hypothetical protein